jgi:hypothetical protein
LGGVQGSGGVNVERALVRGGGSTLCAQWTQNVDRAVWRVLFSTFAAGGDQNVDFARGSAPLIARRTRAPNPPRPVPRNRGINPPG